MTVRIALRVAFGFAPLATSVTWTDISQWADLASQIRLTRGASDELAQTQPSTMSLTLDNTDGRFTAELASSPYYPWVRPDCPIQLGVITLSGKNYVRNPGFENASMDQWASSTTSPVFAVIPDNGKAHSGTYSLAVGWNNTSTGGVIEQTVYGLDVGVTYTLSGWVWVPVGSPSVRWLIDGGSPGTASAVTGAWTQITKTFTATSTSHTVQLTTTLTSPSIGNSVWLDDVQVEVGSSATSLDSVGARVHWRFYGVVNQWNLGWKGLQPVVDLTATDFFKILSKLPQLDTLLAEEIKELLPVIYYPLTEPSTSVSAGDIAGTGAGSLVQAQVGTGGTVTFFETAGPAATGVNVLKFAPAGAANGIRLDAYMGAYAEEQTTLTNITFECWFQTSTAGRYFMAARSNTFQHEIVFGLTGSGYLIIEHTGSGGTRTVSTVNATNLADGTWHHVVYDELNQDVYIDGGAPISVTVTSMLALRYLSIGGYPDQLWDGSVAHAAIYTGNATPTLIADHYDAGTTGYAGEDADARILRLSGYAGIAAIDPVGDFSAVASQGAGGSSALEMMRAVESTEGGRLASHRDGHALLFQSRTIRYNAAPALSIDYGELETADVSLADDDQKLVNQYKVVRPGGATQRVVAAESVAAFGPAPKEDTILKITDGEVLDAANWRVSRYAVPRPELRELPIQAYAQSVATYRILLDADISTVLQVTGFPASAPASTATAVVEGYVEEIGQERHRIQFHTSRAQTDAVWTLDDTTYSVLGTSTRLGY
ncbi:carbohydrate binding domain-containing protein [Streptomyces sp. NPDC001194]|uniref:carbohydrate binding domain-containing protein n=1 Tax=Streptomyces sp. NPDC001194 TaxID=3364547 RepID=UPI0036B69F34